MSLSIAAVSRARSSKASIPTVACACLVLPLAILVKATGTVLRGRSAKIVLVSATFVIVASSLAATIVIMAGDA